MRWLGKDCRNIHDGEIWIVGGGPSLEEFPNDFFDDKVHIVTNGSIQRFPPRHDMENRYYHFYHSVWMDKVIEIDHELLKQCIMLVPSGDFDRYWEKPEQFPFYEKPIWSVWGSAFNDDNLRESIEAIMGGKDYLFPGAGTVIHSAIQVALVLGAKKVTLTGCEMKTKGNQIHARTEGMKEMYDKIMNDPKVNPTIFTPEWRQVAYKVWRVATHKFAVEMAKHNRELIRYYYPDKYEVILAEEELS